MEKIIHQTWKNTELKEVEKIWVESVKEKFVGYEYKFWTDEDNERLIRTKYPEFQDFYKELTPVEKSDFCRYLYIHQYGGVYLDIDVKMNRFLELGEADVILCDQTEEANTEKLEIVVDPFFLAGKKGCNFFYSLCQNIVRGTIYKHLSISIDKLYSLKTLYKTGPIMLTKFYLLNKHKYNIKVLKGIFTTNRHPTKIPKHLFHGIHMQYNSWLKEEDRRF